MPSASLKLEGLSNGTDSSNAKSSQGVDIRWMKMEFRTALPQFLATSAKNLLLLTYGMTLGFATIVIPSVDGSNQMDLNSTLSLPEHKRPDPLLRLNKEEISWLSSINHILVPVGCLVSGQVTAALGRKRSMMVANLPFVAAWLLFHFASNTAMLYTALVLSGIAGGLLEAPVLTYVAEITLPQLRGILSATSSMCVILGVFIQFVLGSHLTWRTVALINLIAPATALVALFLVPESPYWLVTKNRVKDAEKSLCWLRGWVKPSRVQYELNELVRTLSESTEANANKSFFSSWRNYIHKSFLKPYFLVSAAFFVGHFGGMTPLQTYAINIFDKLGVPIDSYDAAMYLGTVELLGTLLCVILIHWTGKRPLTMVSMLGTSLCFASVATYSYLYPRGVEGMGWLPLTLLLGAAFLSHSGIRLLPWVLIGEVYPANVRATASGASGSIGYVFGFASNKMFFFLESLLTRPGLYWFYAAVGLIGLVLMYLILPETEARTLHEIQYHFQQDGIGLVTNEFKRKPRTHTSVDTSGKGITNPGLVPDNAETHI